MKVSDIVEFIDNANAKDVADIFAACAYSIASNGREYAEAANDAVRMNLDGVQKEEWGSWLEDWSDLDW